MRDDFNAIQAAGASLAAIGNGTPDQAAAAAKAQSLPFPVYTDPERASYQAAGLRDSLAASLSPSLVVNGLKAFAKGFRQSRMQGSALQQGGVLIVDPGGQVRARYVSKTGGDHPSTEWILGALAGTGG